jgi:hypothetical protein
LRIPSPIKLRMMKFIVPPIRLTMTASPVCPLWRFATEAIAKLYED